MKSENRPIDIRRALATRAYYVEFRGDHGDGNWVSMYYDGGSMILLDITIYGLINRQKKAVIVPLKLYNKTWRLWRVKPTVEERAMAKWETDI